MRRLPLLFLLLCLTTCAPRITQADPPATPSLAHDPSTPPSVPQAPVMPSPTKINPKDGAVMCYVPAGPFAMGDDDQEANMRHSVTLSGYYIYKNDVTVAMYRKFCKATRKKMPDAPSWGWHDDHPVVKVSWDDAKAYCAWAGVHLPTEAQWEKAARGTEGRQYPWGNTFDKSKLWAPRDTTPGTAPVGSIPAGASPCGCLDMAGNVWQWCADWYDKDYWKSDRGADPVGPGAGEYRVWRGGSWDFDFSSSYFRASSRFLGTPAYINDSVGFRGASGL